jgi:hypothetical protein
MGAHSMAAPKVEAPQYSHVGGHQTSTAERGSVQPHMSSL